VTPKDGVVLPRREAIRLSLAALVPGILPQAQRDSGAGAGALPWPGAAGRQRDRVTDYENDPFIVGVEEKLRCTCGCNLSVYVCRTTDFSCGVSPAMHREVVGLVEEGRTAAEILDAFIGKYGEVVLMAPPKRGFNIAGYVVPGISVTIVGAVMVWILARRSRRVAAVTAAEVGEGVESGALSAEETARIEAELHSLDL
jgi:cytochrome c-type biogenesis protein CcmH/NrfF